MSGKINSDSATLGTDVDYFNHEDTYPFMTTTLDLTGWMNNRPLTSFYMPVSVRMSIVAIANLFHISLIIPLR